MYISVFDTEKFIIESNAIEGYFGEDYAKGTPHFDQHFLAFEYLLENKLNQKNILVAHGILTRGLLKPEQSGAYRKENVEIGRRYFSGYFQVVYRPCSFIEVPNKTLLFFKTVRNAKSIDDCWDCHCMFEDIHPFVDGNGRIGRCILNAQLVKLGHEPTIILSANRQDYYKRLQTWRMVKEMDL